MSQARSRQPLPIELERLLHDLRGTLNAVRMQLELLKRATAGDAAAQSLVGSLEQQFARLGEQIPAAFAVAAIERGELAPVNLRSVVEAAVRDHGIDPVSIAEGAWPQVRADGRLLALAVAHLARNAVDATRAGGSTSRPPRIGFETPSEGGVTLVVRDWGPGLRSTSPRSLIRLTPPDGSERIAAGLLTVERIARLHGGTIEFVQPQDGGAEVRLTLSSKQEPAADHPRSA